MQFYLETPFGQQWNIKRCEHFWTLAEFRGSISFLFN